MRKSVRILMVVGLSLPLALTTPAWAGDPGAMPAEKSAKRRHTGLGLTIGAVAGTILGGWAAIHTVDDGNGGEGTFFLTWTGLAVAGAVAGYAAGGGFDKDVDTALDRGREAVRQAQDRRQAERAAMAGLRLTGIPGFEQVETTDQALMVALVR